MNKDRVFKLADHIESGYMFSQLNSSVSGCGCVAAHAARLWPDEARDALILDRAYLTDLMHTLGLDWATASDIYYWRGDNPSSAVSKEQAAAMLRHLANTGEVDWNV